VADVEQPGVLEKLKRRSVFRVGAMYLVAAWVLVQVGDTLGEPLSLPGWFQTTLIAALVIGFPITLLLAWIFDITPAGIVRSTEDSRIELEDLRQGRKIDYAIIGALVVAVGLLYLREPESVEQSTDPIVENRSAQESVVPEIAKPAEEPSIAVLPFANMSNDPDQEYFSDGISEDILNALVKNTRMKVVARTSSFQFKGKNQDVREIGAKLDVTHILEGSIRKAGRQIRVTAQLINAVDGKHIWSEQYDRELTDIFKVQDEITGQIVHALTANLLVANESAHPTSNMEAHNALMLGRYHRDRSDLEQAIPNLERAIALDPGYADAYIELANTRITMVGDIRASAREQYPLIRRLMDQVRTLDPDHPGLRELDVYFLYLVDHHYQLAIDEIDALVRQYPNSTTGLYRYGAMLWVLRQYDSALRVYDQALKLDPLSTAYRHSKAWTLVSSGRLNEADESIQVLDEVAHPTAASLISLVALAKGDLDELQSQLDRGPDAYYYPYLYYEYQIAVARAQGHPERGASFLEPLRQIAAGHTLYVKTRVALIEGDVETALMHFEEGINKSLEEIVWLTHPLPIPHHREFFAHPEYQRILEDVGLDDDSISKLEFPPLPF
jgi:TolB-like protein